MFQIEHYQKILEGQCLKSIRLTAPLYILLELCLTFPPQKELVFLDNINFFFGQQRNKKCEKSAFFAKNVAKKSPSPIPFSTILKNHVERSLL